MSRAGIASVLSLPIVAMDRVLGLVIMNARLHEQAQYDLSLWTATLEYFDPAKLF